MSEEKYCSKKEMVDKILNSSNYKFYERENLIAIKFIELEINNIKIVEVYESSVFITASVVFQFEDKLLEMRAVDGGKGVKFFDSKHVSAKYMPKEEIIKLIPELIYMINELR